MAAAVHGWALQADFPGPIRIIAHSESPDAVSKQGHNVIKRQVKARLRWNKVKGAGQSTLRGQASETRIIERVGQSRGQGRQGLKVLEAGYRRSPLLLSSGLSPVMAPPPPVLPLSPSSGDAPGAEP